MHVVVTSRKGNVKWNKILNLNLRNTGKERPGRNLVIKHLWGYIYYDLFRSDYTIPLNLSLGAVPAWTRCWRSKPRLGMNWSDRKRGGPLFISVQSLCETQSCTVLTLAKKKFETAPMEYLGARGTMIHEKNLKSKISCQTPFNKAFASNQTGFSFTWL